MQKLAVKKIARICHEANKALCNAFGEFGLETWSRVAKDIKDECEADVHAILKNPNHTRKITHLIWTEKKERAGWKYGPIECHRKKEHPKLVPYNELPPEQLQKDALFVAIVKALTKELNYD